MEISIPSTNIFVEDQDTTPVLKEVNVKDQFYLNLYTNYFIYIDLMVRKF